MKIFIAQRTECPYTCNRVPRGVATQRADTCTQRSLALGNISTNLGDKPGYKINLSDLGWPFHPPRVATLPMTALVCEAIRDCPY